MGEKAIRIVNEARWADGLNVRNRLEEITYVPMRSQEEFLMRMMRENAKTQYGQKCGFKDVHTLEDFQRYVPLTEYNDYLPYVDRISNGERNVLTAYLTEYMSPFNGYKRLPQSRWSVQACYDYNFSLAFCLAANHGLLTDGMTLNLVDSHVEQLPSGISVGKLLGRLLGKRDFNYDQVYVVPLEAANVTGNEDSLYMQVLYALSQEFISIAICDHYEKMLELLRYIEKHWPKLTEDIEHGNAFIEPNPKRADLVREIMELHHIGTQVVEQLWPKLKCIMVNDVDRLSASFELLRTCCGTKVHFIFTGIGSPEGTFSAVLNIDDPQTVFIPDSMFYEFKPKESMSYQTLLTLDQLEIGHSYELVATTLSGLYRYKTHKTFLVVGRYQDTPTVIIDKE